MSLISELEFVHKHGSEVEVHHAYKLVTWSRVLLLQSDWFKQNSGDRSPRFNPPMLPGSLLPSQNDESLGTIEAMTGLSMAHYQYTLTETEVDFFRPNCMLCHI